MLSAGNNTYTYDVENTRVKNLCNGAETQYTYNTNAELSQLLVKTTGSTVTKYVYGNGLIGEETNNTFKTYHFDYRGSTVAITDSNGTVTDTFTYDSYGNVISRTGTTDLIFLYNGEYGVVTDNNDLLYMRARYYSPELRRFVNADILMGDINNSTTLNRYAYANGNPISNIDPFGLAADEGRGGSINYHAVPRNDINGIGLLSDGTILMGINANNEDVYALIMLSEMTRAGVSSTEIKKAINRYVDSKDGNTVIKKDKLLDYYTKFEDITDDLAKLMLRNESIYTTYNTGDEQKSIADIPLSWIINLMEFKRNVQNNGIWDLKQLERWNNSSLYCFNGNIVDADAPGNIMYGYMGKAYGIPDKVLYYAAGIAQIVANTSTQQWVYTGTGDDPVDYNNIKRGIEYYNLLHK